MKKIMHYGVLLMVLLSVQLKAQTYIKMDASFYSRALDEVRKVDIYLPGDYFVQAEVKYPVIYYLHGAGGNQNEVQYFAATYFNTHAEDSTITSPPAIVVGPSGDCEPYRGSFWVNSALYGNFEDYIIEDLISFIESEFRVMEDKEFRFITGQSMGGYGSAYLSLKHHGLFRAAGPGMAAHLLYTEEFMQTWVDTLAWENGSYHFQYESGGLTRLFFTTCGAFSPNLELEPEPIELLFDTLGQFVDTVFEKWQPYIPGNLVQDLTPEDNLAFFLQCGTNDEYYCYPPYEIFSEILDEKGIEYAEAYHSGGHHWDPETSVLMCKWMDSLIAVSYEHVGVLSGQMPLRTELHVFPNPVKDHMEVSVNFDGDGILELLNVQGIVLESKAISSSCGNTKNFRIDLSFYPSGMYLLKLKSAEGTLVKKILRQ